MALIRDPRTGQLVEVPDGSPAALAQGAALQPLTPAAGGLGPAERLVTGTLGLPVAFGRDVANQLGTRGVNLLRGAVGAEQLPLPGMARTSQLLGEIGSAAQGVGQQQELLSSNIRGALDLPAAATPTPTGVTPLAPTAAPGVTNAQVLAQDRANLAAAFPTPAPYTPPTLTPAQEATNARLAAAINPNPVLISPTAVAGGRPVGTEFTQQNTSTVTADGTITSALRQPDSGGINFGFGVDGGETARQYLDRLSAQDAQRRLLADQRGQEATREADVSRLRSLQNDPVRFRQELRLLELTSPFAQQSQQLGAELAGEQQRGISNATAQQIQAAGTAAAAAARAGGTVTAADTAAQARLAAAERTAQAGQELELLRQLGPTGQSAQARADLARLQTQLALDALGQNDVSSAQALAAGTAPRQTRVAVDALGNPIGRYRADGSFVPYTREELEAVRSASAITQGR